MPTAIKIAGVYSEIVSFAMQQNHVPVMRQLVIKNDSDEEAKNITIRIASDPDIADAWTTELDSLMPDQEHILEGIDIRLSASRLFALTERINGTLKVTVSGDGEILAEENRDLSFLSYDEWSGANTYPEFLAAFVTPNHPYVIEVIKKAGALLSDWTGTPSFTGYQSKNPNNVRMQMAAVYGALQQENIAYCMPPASFEENGQKLRLSGTIREQKLGTCLDLALLYAGCLEAAGLHAMVVIIKGHAFTACWLEEESFAECVQDDVSALTKRIAPGINEICVVETTAFTAGKGLDFETAVSAAENHLRNPEDFIYLVDIHRSRGSGIRPIPQRKEDGSFLLDEDEAFGTAAVTGAPDELEILGKLTQVDSIAYTRQQMWERKLLDLSLRNALLNFRVTKSAIQLLVNSLHDLEDALSGGEEFQIMSRPQDMEHSPRDNNIYESIHNESIWNTLIQSEFLNHRIRTFLDEASLSAAISNLYRSAKSSMEENGANTLYLAFGFLKWYESGVSEKPRYAPLVMIPVDIIRKSAQRGYVIRLRDEEPQFNVTLLEMLRMNFGMSVTGLDPLPTDAQGIDIKMVFHIVRQIIMDKARWDVEELAFMGIFSFTQFIMWNDIRNRMDDLARNKVVSSLISGQMEWTSDIAFPSPEALDDTVMPADLAVPIAADSSQLAAIYAAGQGHSFVLHGPPGTGKSQTITNIIANALYNGKSVLFVAEKMAALSVVDKRLTAIGIGAFCLELHSNKARKKDVLDQLEKALNVGRIKRPQSYHEEAEAILALRQELNGVVRELHKPRSFGFSLFDAISRAEQYEGYPDGISFTGEQIDSLTAREYTHWRDLCDMLTAAGLSCGGVYNHALREYKNPHYSQGEKEDLERNLKAFQNSLSALKDGAEQVNAVLRFGKIQTYAQYKALSALCSRLAAAIPVPAAVLSCRDLPAYEEKINDLCASGRKRDAIKEELCASFSGQLLDFDAETALLQWNQAETSWFIPKMLGKSRVAKSIRLYALNTKSYRKAETPNYLKRISEYQQNNDNIHRSSPFLQELFSPGYHEYNCDWSWMENVTQLALSIQKAVGTIAAGAMEENAALDFLCDSLDRGFERFIAENRSVWNRYSDLMETIEEQENALSQQFHHSFTQWQTEADWISSMTEKVSRWIANLDLLRDYCAYLLLKSEAEEAHLPTIYTVLEDGTVKETELTGAWTKSISKACALRIIDSSPILRDFRGYLFQQKIDKFKAIHQQYEGLTRQELAARLSEKIPVLSAGVSDSSDVGILQRAIKSGGRMTPLRKLFESIPGLLRRLCPCMLMSPISVAQYLDAKYPAFDLVVFDEASQVPTSVAVGAIARGNELIVVGDPKQLPPTSFFSANQMDEDNYEKEDLESVLDDCLALSMPQEHLLWHYRSRHESLIAFSNRKYYDNKLYTFPSPNDMVSQLRLIPVEGFYDRGKTKQNKAEAEAILHEVIRRLSDPILKYRSLGIVTFSSVQQNLISDMLEIEFARHPDLDDIAHNAEEPLFVKNLENVQGDERDVILFSIGYGPDEKGRVALNFGPLNREGGWRRLNVAVSRARYEMLVFSVLKPEQIDLNRSRSDGLAGLKAFLTYAAGGALAPPDSEGKKDVSHGVVERIAEKIRGLGYAVHTNIGCSGYHVDIGVIHPDDPDTYLLGILCDSENYYEGGTALDRNYTQEAVLRGLGWNISRIWALDWWDNPHKELERLKLDIDAASKGSMKKAQEAAEPAAAHTLAFERIDEPAVEDVFEQYQVAQIPAVVKYAGNSEYFSGSESTALLRQQIEAVLQVEAPVHRDVLCRRVLEAWGITRMGARISRRFDSLFSAMHIKSTKQEGAVFFWRAEMDTQQYDVFRVPSAEDPSRRNLEHIPAEEIAAAIRFILHQQIGMVKEDLDREVSRAFGFARCTEAMQKYILAGLEVAVSREWATVEENRVNVAQ